jgi:hypothetical protein
MSDDDGFGRDDLDALAERAVDSILRMVRRANAFAGGVLIFAIVACVGGFLLGYAALSDGMQTVWVVLGGFFAILAIGCVVVAMWRLRSVRQLSAQLGDDLRSLIGADRNTERTVIETIEVSEASEEESALVVSRQFYAMQDAAGDRLRNYTSVATALHAVTSFPFLMVSAALISFVFLGLGVLFAIGLAI